VKVTPAGSRSVRFREAKFFSRRVACTISAHSENTCSAAETLHNRDKLGVVESHSIRQQVCQVEAGKLLRVIGLGLPAQSKGTLKTRASAQRCLHKI